MKGLIDCVGRKLAKNNSPCAKDEPYGEGKVDARLWGQMGCEGNDLAISENIGVRGWRVGEAALRRGRGSEGEVALEKSPLIVLPSAPCRSHSHLNSVLETCGCVGKSYIGCLVDGQMNYTLYVYKCGQRVYGSSRCPYCRGGAGIFHRSINIQLCGSGLGKGPVSEHSHIDHRFIHLYSQTVQVL